MNQRTTFALSSWVRLVVLSLLLGFGLVTGTILASRTAHAQSLSSVTITDCTDDTQLRSAIANAASGDTITFGCSGDIKLTGTLTISKNLTLDGSGQSVTLDGQNAVEVLQVNTNVNFTLNSLTIAHGSASNGIGGGLLYLGGGTVSISNSTFVDDSSSNVGGGLFTEVGGTVNISSSTFTNNSAPNGGGLYNNDGTVNISNSTFASNSAPNVYGGGGLDNVGGGTVNISNSTFASNSAPNSSAGGGGLLNADGTVSVSSSTFANNSASNSSGGGLFNFSGTMSISASTIANNSATNLGGGLFNYNGGAVSIIGSIVANNSNGNCYGALTNQGYDLSSDSSCRFTGTGSLQNTNPMLASGLANNGGPTQTLALLDGSPAINKIPSGSSCPLTDQRGIARPQGPACDIGAFEFRVPVLNLPDSPITVNATGTNGAPVTYTATASEPDDASATPTVNCTPSSGSTFPIGTTTVNCTASDTATPPDTTTGSFSVVVQPTLTVSVPGVNATEGSAFSSVVATGTAYGTSNPLSASINWGDGNSSAGSVTLNPDGSYSVSGSHTYTEEGSYALTVTVNDSGSLSATGNGSATVADAALTLTQFKASSPKVLHGSLKATFTDADPGGSLSDYTATINWGDGNTVPVIIVKGKLSNTYSITGTHTYAKKGVYTLTVTVSDSGGSQITKAVTLTVK